MTFIDKFIICLVFSLYCFALKIYLKHRLKSELIVWLGAIPIVSIFLMTIFNHQMTIFNHKNTNVLTIGTAIMAAVFAITIIAVGKGEIVKIWNSHMEEFLKIVIKEGGSSNEFAIEELIRSEVRWAYISSRMPEYFACSLLLAVLFVLWW